MSNKVLEHIAQKYDSVRKGVKAVMGGRVLEYEAKTIKNEGIKEGMEKGIEKGIEKGSHDAQIGMAKRLLTKGGMTLAEIADICVLDLDEVKKIAEDE